MVSGPGAKCRVRMLERTERCMLVVLITITKLQSNVLKSIYSLVLAGCFIQSTEHVMEENAARLAVNIITIASFPELL